MDDKKDIGKAFKERLEELQESPSDLIWNKIESELDQKKKRIIPFWIKIAGVAVLLLTIGGVLVQKNRKTDAKTEITNQNKSIKNKEEVSKENNTDYPLGNKKDYQISTENKNVKKTNKKNELDNTNNISIPKRNNTSISKNKSIENRENSQSNNSHSYAKKQKYKTTNLNKTTKVDRFSSKYIDNNKVKEKREFATTIYHPISSKKYNYLNFCFAELPKIKEDNLSREKEMKEKLSWKVSVKGTPIFSGSILNDYFIDSSLDDNVSYNVGISYGLQLSVPISNDIRLRTGIHKLNFSSNVHKIDINALGYTSNISYVEGVIDEGSIYTTYADEESIDLTQKINYFEIPLEVSFRLLDKKIGVNVITGMSALMLGKNTVHINNETKIGRVKNLNKLSYTGNIGLGIHYKFTKEINISVDPLFKFKFRGYNNVNNVSYYFGVYSGFSYKF